MVFTTVPESVTPEVVRACGQLGLVSLPVFVSIAPTAGALPNKCIVNAQAWVESHGGEVVMGWKVNHWPGVLVEFLGHALIRSESFGLRCITPDRRGATQVLFLEDARITYDHTDPLARMPGKRIPSSNHQDVATFISIEEKISAIKMKHPPTSGTIAVYGEDAIALQRLERGKQNSFRDIALRTWRKSDPCPCESGKSFQACCKRGMELSQIAGRAR